MKVIKILGTGCPKCTKLREHIEKAAQELGIDIKIEKVTDVNEITEMGLMITPALIIDGELKTQGSVPPVQLLKSFLQ